MTAETSKKTCCAPAREGGAEIDKQASTLERENAPAKRVSIPGGKGLVGTNQPELPIDGENPLRSARIKPFEMDETVVTNARFAEFVAATGYVTDAEKFGDSFVFVHLIPGDPKDFPAVPGATWWHMVPGANWRAPHGPGSEDMCLLDHPVVQVTWRDAVAFAEWAGGRLPTEAEWEHAARGGLGDVRFPWGDKEPNDRDFFPCNIWQGRFPEKNLGLDGYLATAPAKSFEPNGYGLYNMVGNVWQYTGQAFKVKSLKKHVQREHADKKGYKLGKGGSFLCHASYCYRYRIAARTGTSPDSSTSHQSFRLVYDI
ncbi:MAG: formylglycine-generating enzyme family protein [Pseudomonadota bacterium]|nr:formylglycine-generating enzyme family protein [Pseudomonadota bacterium]